MDVIVSSGFPVGGWIGLGSGSGSGSGAGTELSNSDGCLG